MEGKRTVEDIIQEAVSVLNSLTFPLPFVETLGMPVALVAANLKACLEAFNEERKKAAEAAAAEQTEKESPEGSV